MQMLIFPKLLFLPMKFVVQNCFRFKTDKKFKYTFSKKLLKLYVKNDSVNGDYVMTLPHSRDD
ncbi:CLUMA_CG016781, isoform A [Clunio marinus]|uniref:CLUMA_CG016781, isoform A n=1 Tax=Clunio marinus TaxID=568069 RepID=A0A1J1IU40_9DIPT|nr:CLUMA_CG016781, isoform A [Clunio marinus]